MDHGRAGHLLITGLTLSLITTAASGIPFDSVSAHEIVLADDAVEEKAEGPEKEEKPAPYSEEERAEILRKYNALMTLRRYDQAVTLAKAARRREPESPHAAVMYYKVKLAQQDEFNAQLHGAEFEPRLDQEVTVHRAATLRGLLSILKEMSGVPIGFGESDVEERYGDRPVAFNVDAMPLHMALDRLLAPLNLDYERTVEAVGSQRGSSFLGIVSRDKLAAERKQVCATCHQDANAATGSHWLKDFATGRTRARASKRPLVVLFEDAGQASANRLMKNIFESGPGAAAVHPKAVTVRLDGQDPSNADLLRRYEIESFPTVLALDGDDRLLLRWEGYSSAERWKRLNELRELPERFAKEADGGAGPKPDAPKAP